MIYWWFCEQGPPHAQGKKFAKMTDEKVIEFVFNLKETCEIDIVKKYRTYTETRAITLNNLGRIVGVSRERIRQIESGALKKLKRRSTWDICRAWAEYRADSYGDDGDPYARFLPDMIGVGHDSRRSHGNNRWAEAYNDCQKPRVRK